MPQRWRFCVAPMMAWTDRHCRYFMRLLSRNAMLYTPMISADAIVHGKREILLAYDPAEHPLGLQIGGSDPEKLAICAAVAREYGYDEINLNAGCPGKRAGYGMIGAHMMKDPQRTADCIRALCTAGIPVSIKCRTGIDNQDSYELLYQWIAMCAQAGCCMAVVHARKALLKGLTPRQNREIPPLQYQRVYQLKKDFPEMPIILNGGLQTATEAAAQLKYVDGVMLGRAVYHCPRLLLETDRLFYNTAPSTDTPEQAIAAFMPYMERELRRGITLHSMLRHVLGFYRGLPGGARWRRQISMCSRGGSEDLQSIRELFSHSTQSSATAKVAKEAPQTRNKAFIPLPQDVSARRQKDVIYRPSS